MRYEKLPKIDRKTKQQDGWYFKFRRYNPELQRYDVVPVDAIPTHIRNCQDEDVIAAWVKTQSAEEAAVQYRAKQRLEWKLKHHNFEALLSEFMKFHRKGAPNSYARDIHSLEQYVFPFFLDRDYNLIEVWNTHYSEFREYLETIKPLKWTKESLSINTQNNIIKALNRFMSFMMQEKGLTAVPKCATHPRHMGAKVTVDDLWSEKDIRNVSDWLQDQGKCLSRDAFIVLNATGLRISELIGLSPSFVVSGPFEGKHLDKIHRQLEVYDLEKYKGYLCLESQVAFDKPRLEQSYIDRWKQSWEVGEVPREPLKCRKEIAPKWFRYVPIFVKGTIPHLATFDVWRIVGERFNAQLDLMERQKPPFGKEGRNYLMFDGLTAGQFYADLRDACLALKIRIRGPHDCRHTFLTWFYDVTNEDRQLSKKVAGHEDERSMNIYAHLSELMGRERTEQIQRSKRISFDG